MPSVPQIEAIAVGIYDCKCKSILARERNGQHFCINFGKQINLFSGFA